MGGGDGLGGALFGLLAVAFIVYAIVYIIVVIAITGVIASMLALGLLSFFMSKSGKALVNQTGMVTAFYAAVQWSGTLTVGCIVGSFGLMFAISALTEGSYIQDVFYKNAVGTNNLQMGTSFLLNWVGYDAMRFFVSVALVLYLANRIYIARKLGGTHWLSVIPPIGAMVIFFVSKNFNNIISVLTSRDYSKLYELGFRLFEEMIFPIRLCYLGFTDPDRMIDWIRTTLWQSDGSFFALGALLPSIFFLIAAILLGKSVLTGNEAASAA